MSLDAHCTGRQFPNAAPTWLENHDLRHPAKRLKVEDSTDELSCESSKRGLLRKTGQESFDESLDSPNEDVVAAELESSVWRPTELEAALPAVKSDREAIEEYEAMRANEAGIPDELKIRLDQGKWRTGKSSIYVDAFNLALDTVLEDEKHLFDEKEIEVFRQWRELDYEAQYVRLFLRKTSAWHRISRLTYYDDISDISTAVKSLQRPRSLPDSSTSSRTSPGELVHSEGTNFGTEFTFADSSEERITTLEEASSLLNLEELRSLAKDAKVQGKNKAELLIGFRKMSRSQQGLHWPVFKRTKSERSVPSDASINGVDEKKETPVVPEHMNRDQHFLRIIMAGTGECIRLSLTTLKLFERVHLVFYRSTEWTEKSLTTIILAQISRQNFPGYIVSRSTNIFASRAALLEFEAALRTQNRVDNILESNGNPNDDGLQEVLSIFDEVYPRWNVLLQEEYRKEKLYDTGEGAYLRRFSPAWVYTRIVHKGAYVLGRLKMHEREHTLLSELLAQHLFHAARRGAWYQRKALLEEHYMAELRPPNGIDDPEKQKKHWGWIALRTCMQGLQDNDCHIIFHYDLQKRIKKLEKRLKVAKREQHDFGHVLLEKATEVTVTGIRVQKEYPKQQLKQAQEHARSTKTIWIDEYEGGGECSVEEMCLSWYRSQGKKGYHSEGGIIRTLFAYLFYDILFMYIPNVFQTQYQTCPLDLHTDTFYPSRASEINHRLAEIANGAAARLIREVDEREREKNTCVVGLQWDFPLEDLLEVAECFDNAALANVCKVMAQEYSVRGGGIPDLFLWDPVKKEVMFAEVKSENDRLSDTQRLWIHVLTGAGIRVELCHAVAREVKVIAVD